MVNGVDPDEAVCMDQCCLKIQLYVFSFVALLSTKVLMMGPFWYVCAYI